MKTEINSNEILAAAVAAVENENNNATSSLLTKEVEIPATENKVAEINAAIASIKTAITAVKSEVLSLRTIVRAVRDMMTSNAEVAAFAQKLGLKPNANKAAVDACVKRLTDLLPYYTVTKLPSIDGKSVHEIINAVTFAPTSKEGVFVARAVTDIFKILESAWLNDNAFCHQEVKANRFYKFDNAGKAVETDKVAISKATDKSAAKAKRLAAVLNENKVEDLVAALVEKFGKDAVAKLF